MHVCMCTSTYQCRSLIDDHCKEDSQTASVSDGNLGYVVNAHLCSSTNERRNVDEDGNHPVLARSLVSLCGKICMYTFKVENRQLSAKHISVTKI